MTKMCTALDVDDLNSSYARPRNHTNIHSSSETDPEISFLAFVLVEDAPSASKTFAMCASSKGFVNEGQPLLLSYLSDPRNNGRPLTAPQYVPPRSPASHRVPSIVLP